MKEKEYYKRFCHPLKASKIQEKENELNSSEWKDGPLEVVSGFREKIKIAPTDKNAWTSDNRRKHEYHVINCKAKKRDMLIKDMKDFGWNYIGRCGNSCYFIRVRTDIVSYTEKEYIGNLHKEFIERDLFKRKKLVAALLVLIVAMFLIRFLLINIAYIPNSPILLQIIDYNTPFLIAFIVFVQLHNIFECIYLQEQLRKENDKFVKDKHKKKRDACIASIIILLIINILSFEKYIIYDIDLKAVTKLSDDICFIKNNYSNSYNIYDTDVSVSILDKIYDKTNKKCIDWSKDDGYRAKLYVELVNDDTNKVEKFSYQEEYSGKHSKMTDGYYEVILAPDGVFGKASSYSVNAYYMIYDSIGNRIKYDCYAEAEFSFSDDISGISSEGYSIGGHDTYYFDNYKVKWKHN